jgi:uncharacterized protein YjgD (DUF1641 family)
MAHPISFKPQPVDPQKELMRRVEAAPREHAEALLGAWDLLQTAHEQGLLDLAQGLIGGRDIVAGKLAAAAGEPESIAAMRNAIALGRILASIDPDMLHRMSRAMAETAEPRLDREKDATQAKIAIPGRSAAQARPQTGVVKKPLSLWQIFRKVTSQDGRRGLGFAANLLTALGRAQRPDTKG